MLAVITEISAANKELSIPIVPLVPDTTKSSGDNKKTLILIVKLANTLTLFYISILYFYIIMSGRGGRGGRSPYRSGCDKGNCGRRGKGRGHTYFGAISAAKKGLSNTLGTSVFDYFQKAAADQTRTSWEKLIQYISTNYSQDISNELQNKITVNLVEPIHTPKVTVRHTILERMIRTDHANIQTSRAT